MYMSKEEIAGRYRRAVDQKAQIEILADLNGCGKEDIIKVLTEMGFKVKTRKPRITKKDAEKNIVKKSGNTAKHAVENEITQNEKHAETAAKKTSQDKSTHQDEDTEGREDKKEDVQQDNTAGMQPDDRADVQQDHPASMQQSNEIPEVVRQAVRKEMICVQNAIDTAQENVNERKRELQEAQDTLQNCMDALRTLKDYIA